ncbi:MAG: aldehyde dehydrogenase family protein [Candidatus Levyibacteriota bacterium]
MKLTSINPSRNYEVLGEIESSTAKEIKEAVENTRTAFPQWSSMAISERCNAIQSFVNIAKSQEEELARLIAKETGRPIKSARSNVSEGIRYFEDYITIAEKYLAPKVTVETDKELHKVYLEPWGVIACICPWNYPFLNVAWQCGQALIAGNTIVYKNSEENPLFAEMLSHLIEQSEIPKGVFNVVYGDGNVGDLLVHQDINMISFTGSTNVGQQLTKIAAEKFIPIVTELGGSAPGIVFEDIDIDDKLIEYIVGMRLTNNGQACDAIKRLIVHESKFEEVVKKICDVIKKKKVGDALNEDTDIGPLIAKRQADLLEAQVQDAIKKGAKVEVRASKPQDLKGAYYTPTVLTNVNPTMRVWYEETFGPVLPIIPFKDEAQAIRQANHTEYGLSAHVFTNDKKRFNRVARQLQAGSVAQNFAEYWNVNNPFGGYKKSGMGRINGEYGFEDFTQPKLISEEKYSS